MVNWFRIISARSIFRHLSSHVEIVWCSSICMRFDWGRRLSIHGIRQFVGRKMLKKSATRPCHICWYHLVQGLACTDNHVWLLIANILALSMLNQGANFSTASPTPIQQVLPVWGQRRTLTMRLSCLKVNIWNSRNFKKQPVVSLITRHVIIKPSWYTSWYNIVIFRYNIIYNFQSQIKLSDNIII